MTIVIEVVSDLCRPWYSFFKNHLSLRIITQNRWTSCKDHHSFFSYLSKSTVTISNHYGFPCDFSSFFRFSILRTFDKLRQSTTSSCVGFVSDFFYSILSILEIFINTDQFFARYRGINGEDSYGET